MEESLDRISGLPEGILHKVFSFLLVEDVIQAAATCKRLNQVWNTLPYLDLGQRFFPPLPPPVANTMAVEGDDTADVEEEGEILESDQDDLEDVGSDPESEDSDSESEEEEDYEGNVRKREKLFTFLDQTLSRRRMQDLDIHRFRLGMTRMTKIDAEICEYLNKWIDYLVHCNIKEFELEFLDIDNQYDVPSILLAAKSLYALSIQLCTIPCDSIINMPSLRKLSLSFVRLDGKKFNEIINACLNLEYIDIRMCQGLRKLEVSTLSHLRCLKFHPDVAEAADYNKVEDEALVEAQSLEELRYSSGALKVNIVIKFEGYLKTLHLSGAKFTNIWFCELISRLPCLQELWLSHLPLKSIEISSSSLKRLILSWVFRSCHGIGEITVHAPNLVYLRYVGPSSYTFPSSLAVKDVVLAIVDLQLMQQNEEKCRELMQLLSVFDYSEVVKLECSFLEHMIIPVEWRSELLEPLAHIKHLILQGRFLADPLCSMKKFIESLLWISPNMVSLSLKERHLYHSTGRGFAIELLMKVPVSGSTVGRVLRDCILDGMMELECGDPEVWKFLKSCFTSDVNKPLLLHVK